MFENYKQMTASEQAEVKLIHKALRKETCHRYGNLAWGFLRSLKINKQDANGGDRFAL
jgi:hypothetical protein